MPRRKPGPCSTPGCPGRATHAGKCDQHKRGSTAQRGYGSDHQRLRTQWQVKVDMGGVSCWRCGAALNGQAWQLGHDDVDRSRYRGPECIPCNTSTATRGG